MSLIKRFTEEILHYSRFWKFRRARHVRNFLLSDFKRTRNHSQLTRKERVRTCLVQSKERSLHVSEHIRRVPRRTTD